MSHKEAKFPRIIVDPRILTEVRVNPLVRAHGYDEEMGYISGLIKKDMDGTWFVDYLNYLEDNADDFKQRIDFLLRHREVVLGQNQQAASLDGRTAEGRSRRAKASWIRTYHNSHLEGISSDRLQYELKVSKRDLIVGTSER